VIRLIRNKGLISKVRIKKYKSFKGEVGKIVPNLLNNNFKKEKPNEKG